MWTLAVPTRSVQDDGTAMIVAELSDDTGLQYTVTVTMSPERALRVLSERADGAEPLAGFEAWSA